MFGENVTTIGLDVDAAEYGDLWTVGGAVLRVSAPRVPCATFAKRMEERSWVKRFAARGRAGTYLAVVSPGTIRPGDPITVTPSGSGVTIPSLLAAWMGDLAQMEAALTHDGLDAESRGHFTRSLAARRIS